MRFGIGIAAAMGLVFLGADRAQCAEPAAKEPSAEQLVELFELLTSREQTAVVSIKAALAKPTGYANLKQSEIAFGYAGAGRAFLRASLIKAAGEQSHVLSSEMAKLVPMTPEEKVAFIAKYDVVEMHNQHVYATQILDLSKPVSDDMKIVARKYPMVWRALGQRIKTPVKPVDPEQNRRELEALAAKDAARLAELRARSGELNEEIDTAKSDIAKLEVALAKLKTTRASTAKERANLTDQRATLTVRIDLLKEMIAAKQRELDALAQEMIDMSGELEPGGPR